MKNRILQVCLIALALSVFSAAVQAEWVNPPPFDPNQPGGRVLEWTFDNPGDPLRPYTWYGPEWDSPGWECDEVTMTGLDYFAADPTGQGRTGMYGIDNRFGELNRTGALVFHVNNFDDNDWKWMWDEAEYYPGHPAPGHVTFGVVWPAGYNGDWDIINPVDLPGGWLRDNMDGWIQPNPWWEEFVWTFDVPVGHWAFLDSFAVATLCIPEPTTLLLLSLGGLALLRRRRG